MTKSQLLLAAALATCGALSFSFQANAQVTGTEGGASIPDTITTPAASAAMHAQFDAVTEPGESVLSVLSAAAAVGADTAALASPTFAASLGTSTAVTGEIDTGILNDSITGNPVTADGATIEFSAVP